MFKKFEQILKLFFSEKDLLSVTASQKSQKPKFRALRIYVDVACEFSVTIVTHAISTKSDLESLEYYSGASCSKLV